MDIRMQTGRSMKIILTIPMTDEEYVLVISSLSPLWMAMIMYLVKESASDSEATRT